MTHSFHMRHFFHRLCFIAPIVYFSLTCAAFGEETRKLNRLYNDLRIASPSDHAQIALQIEKEWAKSGSTTIDYLYEQALKFEQGEQPTMAISSLGAALDHDPSFAQAYVKRAQIYIDLERYGLALHDLDRAISINPNHFWAYQLGAQIYLKIGSPQKAAPLIDALKKIYPHHPPIIDAGATTQNRQWSISKKADKISP